MNNTDINVNSNVIITNNHKTSNNSMNTISIRLVTPLLVLQLVATKLKPGYKKAEAIHVIFN